MNTGGKASRDPLSFAKRLCLCTGIHALVVIPVLALNLMTGLREEDSEPALGILADALGLWLWLPINSFIQHGRLDLFFLCVPLNSILYGLLFALPLHALAKQKTSRSA